MRTNGSFHLPPVLGSEKDIRPLWGRINREADNSYTGLRVAEAIREIKIELAHTFNWQPKNVSRESVRCLADTLKHLPYLEGYSSIHWTPTYPEDLFPGIAKCYNFRKLEVTLSEDAFPGFDRDSIQVDGN